MDNELIRFKYKNKKFIILAIVMFIFLIAVIIFTLSKGDMNLGFFETYNILFSKMTNNITGLKENEIAVVWNIRLPRILCSVFVGMGLSTAGVIFQSILRNPLADPYTLGVSTGAAFGASLSILLNIMFGLFIPVQIPAFIFALITLFIVIFISHNGNGIISSNLIISGIIVSSILSSAISFIKMKAGENVGAIVFWIMGSLSSRQWKDVFIVAPIVILSSVAAYIFSNDLNIITIGEKSAEALGINTKRILFLYLILGSLITAACVSVSGVIGFVGLIIPHMLRIWFTSDNRVLIPLSCVFGGLILCIADNFTRLIFLSEIPVGVITTLIGGPFFIFIFIRKNR